MCTLRGGGPVVAEGEGVGVGVGLAGGEVGVVGLGGADGWSLSRACGSVSTATLITLAATSRAASVKAWRLVKSPV